jgi:hypothetical protein
MPVAEFQIEELTALAHKALPAWAYCIAHRRNELQPLDFVITIRQSLPPEFILSHYHPKEIPDPFRAQMIYKYQTACLEGR